MIFSAQQLFSNKQAITASANSTNVIDTGLRGTPFRAVAALDGDIGRGTKIPVLIQVTEDFDNLTSLTITVETGASDTLGTSILSQTILAADLVAGKQVAFDVLPNDLTEQFLGIAYTVTGSAPSAGRVMAGITMGNQTNVTGA